MEKRDPQKKDLEHAAAVTSDGSVGAAASLQTPNPDPAAAPILQSGSVLGARYEIIELLGQGGMGAVYKARDRELDRLVALKTIRPDLAYSPSSLKRFKQELILARQVTHKNVVRIYDLGESEGVKYITMEYIEGEDLRYVIQARPDIPEVVNIVRQICQALQAAHAEGVIHRDLKPQNIMRDKNGRVVVMDFGLARSLESSGLTQTGALVGTLEYMSPEQALGQPIDHRSDIFALGLIFYELLARETPFKAESAIASLVRRTQESATPVKDLDSTVPDDLSSIVGRCLEKNVFARYQSAAEILQALNRWQGISGSMESYSAPVASAYSRAGVRTQRAKKTWIIAALALVLLAIAGIIVEKMISRPTGKHQPVSLLIADFKNGTSDTLFDGTLEPAFNIAMEGASFIDAYNREQAKKIAAQLKPGASGLDDYLARLVAEREGVNVVVGGSITPKGSGYKVSVTAIDALTGKTIVSTDDSASDKNSVLPVIARLASKVRKKLGDTTPQSVQLAASETFTADSLESAHEYAVGQQAQWDGKYDEAIRHYSRAIEIDQNFGRAYAGIAAMYANTGQRDQAEKYYRLAMAHMDRMSEREKYRTRASYYLGVRYDAPKAVEELNGLLQQYPDDTAGRSNLALAYFYERDMNKAVEEGRHALDLDPRSVFYRNNLALYAMYAGDFDTAQKEAQTVMQANPAFVKAYVALALSQFAQGKLPEAKSAYEKLRPVSARGESFALAGLADLALYQGHTAEAIKILQPGIAADTANKSTSALAAKLNMLAYAHLLRGEDSAALDNAEKAAAATKNESALYSAAIIYLRAGREKKALEIAQDLAGSLDPQPQIYGKLIQAEAQLQHGRARDAVRIMEEAQKISDSWLGRFTLGKAYLAAQSYPDAYAQFDACLRRRGEATAVFLDDMPSFHVFPDVYYYLAVAQQGLQSPGAADSFKTYLQIKKDADKDPLAADARKRLAAM